MDVILMVKEWTCSDSLSQAPMVLVPKKIADSLDPATLRTQIKKRLSDRERQETETYLFHTMIARVMRCCFPSFAFLRFLKTAASVSMEPWFFSPSRSVLAWSGGV